MNNIRPMATDQQLYDEASLWIVKMDRGLTDDERTALQEWMQAEQKNHDILMEMTQLWDKMDAMSRLSDLFGNDQEQGKEHAKEHSDTYSRARPIRAIAASLLVATGLSLWAMIAGVNLQSGDPIYHTAVGEQSIVMLNDGSQITLNTNTKVQVRYTDQARLLELVSGELHVRVAKDPSRPLSVMAGEQIIQAVGTEFNIEITDQQKIELVVTEGKVKVGVPETPPTNQPQIPSPNSLSVDARSRAAAGEKTMLGDSKVKRKVTEVSADDIAVKLSWRSGNLIFRGESLEEAVKEVGRYTSVEFVFMNEDLKKMRVAGLFKAGDVEGLLATLRENFDIVTHRDDNGKVLLSID